LVQDLRVAGVVAARPGRRTRLRLAYVRRVSRATTRPEVLRTLLEVRHMLRPGRALLRPGVMRGVVADALAGHLPPRWRPR